MMLIVLTDNFLNKAIPDGYFYNHFLVPFICVSFSKVNKAEAIQKSPEVQNFMYAFRSVRYHTVILRRLRSMAKGQECCRDLLRIRMIDNLECSKTSFKSSWNPNLSQVTLVKPQHAFSQNRSTCAQA